MVSVDPPETNKAFAESVEADFPILSDPGKSVARAYGVLAGERQTASRWTFYIGRDGRLLHIDKQVSPASHGEEVAARLKTLGVAEAKR